MREQTQERRDNGGKTINQLSGAKEPPPCIVQVQIKHIKNNITVGGTEGQFSPLTFKSKIQEQLAMSSFQCCTFEIFPHSFLSSFSLKCRWLSVYICRRLSRTWTPRTTARCGRKQLPASGGETTAGILTESGAARRFHQHSLPSH